MKKVKHSALDKDLNNPEIVITNIEKGIIGEKPSIETTEKEPIAFSSYLYDDEKDRDVDFEIVKEIKKINLE
jgi:hypothetical protein